MLPTLTIDIGTTSVKLSVFDGDGSLLDSARHATPTRRDAWGEIYDVGALWTTITGFVHSLAVEVRQRVQRIAITGVGESGGLVRPDTSLASPMILWHDHRGAEYLAPLDAAARERVYAVTGLPVNANYGLSKTAWAVARTGESSPDAQWLNIAEYLAASMTGERWSEPTLASRTMALDLRTAEWSAEICGLVGLDTGTFPPLRPAGQGAGILPTFAAATGLDPDVVVHVAGHDHMVGGVGAGLAAGELLNSTGTTEGLLFLRDTPSLGDASRDAKLANGLSGTAEDFTLFASIPTGGSAFATLQALLGLDAAALESQIDRLHDVWVAGRVDLARIPLVLPQFRGSPPPTKDAAATGAISGLRSDTTAADVILGTFLGLVLQFRDVLDLFPDRPIGVKVIGPASRNPLWLQLKADLLGAPLSVSGFPEVVSRGAQALASGASVAWESTDPREVRADAIRHAALRDWAGAVHDRWEHLKGMPS
jgi:sugar (pentulose or hexulose) kinase